MHDYKRKTSLKISLLRVNDHARTIHLRVLLNTKEILSKKIWNRRPLTKAVDFEFKSW